MIPWARIDSASPAVASWANRLRGWRGLGWMSSTGTCGSSAPPAPPLRTSRPRPSPRRSLWTLDKLHRPLPVGLRACRARVVGDHGLAVARRLGDAHRARHVRPEEQRPEVLLELGRYIGREPRATVDHRQD